MNTQPSRTTPQGVPLNPRTDHARNVTEPVPMQRSTARWLALSGVLPLALGIFIQLELRWLSGAVSPLSALGIALILGAIPGPLLRKIAPVPACPPGIGESFWARLVGKTDAGYWIGTGERLLVLAAMWMQAPTIIVAWLGFKLASKWEAWKNVVQIPNKIATAEDEVWLEARHDLGSWLLNRFWLGTLFNLLAGLLAAYCGSVISSLPPL